MIQEKRKKLKKKSKFKMACELKIKQFEKMTGRKLTEKEKNKIKKKFGHPEIRDNEIEEEEIEVAA